MTPGIVMKRSVQSLEEALWELVTWFCIPRHVDDTTDRDNRHRLRDFYCILDRSIRMRKEQVSTGYEWDPIIHNQILDLESTEDGFPKRADRAVHIATDEDWISQ